MDGAVRRDQDAGTARGHCCPSEWVSAGVSARGADAERIAICINRPAKIQLLKGLLIEVLHCALEGGFDAAR
jgi:hypothetical protein